MGRITKYTTRLIVLLLFFTAATPLFSQQFYPVHTTVQVLPPHGLYLSDYYSGTRDRLVVTLFNRDFDRPFLNVRLRVTIRNGNHFMLRSRDELPAPVITLTPGVPLRLTGADLAPYLMPNRVTIQGHLRNGMLPTGDTEFIVQILDHATGRVLSQAATGRAWLELHQPPQLNLPEQGIGIMFRTPQHIRFQWFPRHIPIAQTVYEFTLRELPDNDVPPQTAFMFGNTIYQTTTRFTTLNLTHLQPLLEPGRRYAWQIRAITMDGIDEIGTFANHGFSEIGWFRLLENCPPPMNVRGEAEGSRAMTIRWQPYHQHQSFIVQYRMKTTNEFFDWNSVEVSGREVTIRQLRPEWTYEFRVGAFCGMVREPVFSEIGSVRLPLHDPALLALCGQPHVPRPELENREPLLDDLRPGDVIYVGGGRPMVLTEVTSLGNGWFSGRGITTVIFLLNEIDFYSEFDRLLINTYRFQIGGTANVVRCADGGQIADLTRPQMPQGGGIVFEVVQLDFTVPPMPEITFNPETGELTIYCVNGTPHRIQVPRNEQGEPIFPFEIIDNEDRRFLLDIENDRNDNMLAEDSEDRDNLLESRTPARNNNVSATPTFDPELVHFMRVDNTGVHGFDCKFANTEQFVGDERRFRNNHQTFAFTRNGNTEQIEMPNMSISTNSTYRMEATTMFTRNYFDFLNNKSVREDRRIPAYTFTASSGITINGVQTYSVYANMERRPARNGDRKTISLQIRRTPGGSGNGLEIITVRNASENIVGQMRVYTLDVPTADEREIVNLVKVYFGDGGTLYEGRILRNLQAPDVLLRDAVNEMNRRAFNQAFIAFTAGNYLSISISDDEVREGKIRHNIEQLLNNNGEFIIQPDPDQNPETWIIDDFLDKHNVLNWTGRTFVIIANRNKARERVEGGYSRTLGLAQIRGREAYFYYAGINFETFTHEMGHLLGLMHPFLDRRHNHPDQPLIRAGTSQNFMDYTNNPIMFWRWQWEIMRRSLGLPSLPSIGNN